MLHIRSVITAVSLAALIAWALVPAPAGAEPVAHLAWEDCGSAGLVTRTFACNTNVGVEQLYVSFVPPAGITALKAIEARIGLVWWGTTTPPPPPVWWELNGCRANSLIGDVGFVSGPYTCRIPGRTT